MSKRAFTLAEVLITLGIIGVVAAMTIPTLISNTNGAQFKSAFKKSLSTLNQAVIMNLALDDYDFSAIKAPNSIETPVEGDDTFYKEGSKKTMAYLLKNRLQSVSPFKYTDEDDVEYSGDVSSPLTGAETGEFSPFFSFSFADGTSFSYMMTAERCVNETTESCYGFIDVNGKTGPNKEIECTNIPGKVNSQPSEGVDDEGNPNPAITCEVEASGITDIYPVRFYGQTVEPATEAARYVLYSK